MYLLTYIGTSQWVSIKRISRTNKDCSLEVWKQYFLLCVKIIQTLRFFWLQWKCIPLLLYQIKLPTYFFIDLHIYLQEIFTLSNKHYLLNYLFLQYFNFYKNYISKTVMHILVKNIIETVLSKGVCFTQIST